MTYFLVNYLLIKALLDLLEELDNLRQFLTMTLGVLCFIQNLLRLLSEHVNLALKNSNLGLQVSSVQLVDIHNVVVPVLLNCATETNTR